MENAVTHYISGKLRNDLVLSRHQQKNVDTLIRISDKFHTDADIPQGQKNPVSEKLHVIESGHQPNFLPYPGVWKKVFLLHQLKEHLNNNGHDVIAVFGFADQNLSTAKLLYENKVPAVNKQGSKKIGFKIPEAEKWKCFNKINKPAEDVWKHELDNFKNYYFEFLPKNDTYSQSLRNNIDTLTGIMETCYTRANNMADLNAFIFARICQDLFDLNVHFFRYSDVQHNNLFIDEWEKILASIPLYSTIYNETIREKKLNLSSLPSDFFPFWYHCACGVKVSLTTDTVSDCKGTCPACKTDFSFPVNSGNDCLAGLMKDMGLSAVVRNVIFSEGLGTRLFVSGAGGGLRYGLIANEISRKLSLNIPITLSWQSRDYYIGIIHMVALNDALRIFNLTSEDLISCSLNEKITRYRNSLLERIENLNKDPENKKEIAKYSGLFRNAATQIRITKKMFSTIPSIIDLLVNFNTSYINHQWNGAMNSAEINDSGEIILLKEDIFYAQDDVRKFSPTEIPRIYNSLDLLHEI